MNDIAIQRFYVPANSKGRPNYIWYMTIDHHTLSLSQTENRDGTLDLKQTITLAHVTWNIKNVIHWFIQSWNVKTWIWFNFAVIVNIITSSMTLFFVKIKIYHTKQIYPRTDPKSQNAMSQWMWIWINILTDDAVQ